MRFCLNTLNKIYNYPIINNKNTCKLIKIYKII